MKNDLAAQRTGQEVLHTMYLDPGKYIFEILLSNGRTVEVPTQKEWERWPSECRRLLSRDASA